VEVIFEENRGVSFNAEGKKLIATGKFITTSSIQEDVKLTFALFLKFLVKVILEGFW
jgi:hypothetical protein